MNRSSLEDHRVGEQISVVDTPSTSESISKKVKRLFTFKRDKKKSKSPQETIEESSSEQQHSKEFRDALNSSLFPYNSSLASSSAMHLSIPSGLHHLNRSNPGSAENVSQCGTNATFFNELKFLINYFALFLKKLSTMNRLMVAKYKELKQQL